MRKPKTADIYRKRAADCHTDAGRLLNRILKKYRQDSDLIYEFGWAMHARGFWEGRLSRIKSVENVEKSDKDNREMFDAIEKIQREDGLLITAAVARHHRTTGPSTTTIWDRLEGYDKHLLLTLRGMVVGLVERYGEDVDEATCSISRIFGYDEGELREAVADYFDTSVVPPE